MLPSSMLFKSQSSNDGIKADEREILIDNHNHDLAMKKNMSFKNRFSEYRKNAAKRRDEKSKEKLKGDEAFEMNIYSTPNA